MFKLAVKVNTEKEYVLNDYELVKSIYADEIEEINENPIEFKMNMKLELSVDSTLIELIKELKFDELMMSKNSIGLPYWIKFIHDNDQVNVECFVFWLKKQPGYFINFDLENITHETIFLSLMENIKAFLPIPEKKNILNWLQEIKEKSVICNDTIYAIYDKRIADISKTYDEEEFENEESLIDKLRQRSEKLLEKKKYIKVKTEIKEENIIKSLYDRFIEDGGVSGDIISDRGSHFQAHGIKVRSMDDIKKYLEYLKTHNKISKATHNILSYRFNDSKKKGLVEGFDDDGEDDAGQRLLGIIQKMKGINVLIVVSRWFGGTMLGNDRYKHINDCGKILLLNNKTKFEFES